MKIGILTFHDAHNYGAVLQAYALKTYLNKDGFDAKIINYHHYTIPDGYPKENNISRWEKFNKFIFELIDQEEKTYISEEELEKLDIDFWICGSDQIWNPELTRGLNKGFFLNFMTKGKKISYATSIGHDRLDEKIEKEFSKNIEQIECISVREKSLKNYLKEFTDKNIEQVLDPVFLLEEQDYDKLILENKYGEYILIYELVPDIRLTNVAKKISENTNIKIIELNDKHKENYFCNQISDAGPNEFLTLMKNAKIIISNSFHATAFSIIFNKDFYIISRENKNARMENILEIVDMKDRLIDNIEDIYNVKSIDYNKANEKLNVEKNKSKKFLKSALK